MRDDILDLAMIPRQQSDFMAMFDFEESESESAWTATHTLAMLLGVAAIIVGVVA